MRGRKISSANFVWPVHFARASTLRKGLPTTFNGFPLFCLLALQFRNRNDDRNLSGREGWFTPACLNNKLRGQARLPDLEVTLQPIIVRRLTLLLALSLHHASARPPIQR